MNQLEFAFKCAEESASQCDLVRHADGHRTVMQRYPIAGHYVYRIRNAGMVQESEWRVE